MREEKINKINLFVERFGNSKSFMYENKKELKNMIVYYNNHSEEEFKKEYPLCTYTLEEMKYFLKSCNRALRNLRK